MLCYLRPWLCGCYFSYLLKQPYFWLLSQPERLERSWHLAVLKISGKGYAVNLDCPKRLITLPSLVSESLTHLQKIDKHACIVWHWMVIWLLADSNHFLPWK